MDLTESEIDALLDVLEYDAMVAAASEDPGWWTWERPGIISQNLTLYRVREFLKVWKMLNG